MILYNTLMGVSAGLALILVPVLARKLLRRQQISPEGWSLTFAVLGVMLTFLAGKMATTWPLTVNPPINILFAEPNFFLGLLLLAAALFLWKRRDSLTLLAGSSKKDADLAYADLRRTLMPISWAVFGLGMILLACSLAIFRFGFVGGAPPTEPISGLLSGYPAVENTFFGILYSLSAIATLLAPWALRDLAGKAARIAGICLTVAGIVFLVFSAMNYYTHIGLLVNTTKGTHYRW